MAEMASERWANQISSVSFLDHPLAGNNNFLATKTDAYEKDTDQQVELFKKFLTLEILQEIRKIKNKK